MEVNKVELSEILGVDERTLTNWQKAGMPIVARGGRGKSNLYDTRQVVAWLLAREKGDGKESPKDRLDRLRGDYEEIRIAKELALLAPPQEYQKAFGGMVEAANEELLAFSDGLVASAKSLLNLDIPRDFVESRVEEIIARLASYDAFDIGASGDFDEDEVDCEDDSAGSLE